MGGSQAGQGCRWILTHLSTARPTIFPVPFAAATPPNPAIGAFSGSMAPGLVSHVVRATGRLRAS